MSLVAAFLVSGGLEMAGAQTAAVPALTNCQRYDKLTIKGSEVPYPSICDLHDPELGGLRGALAEYGIGIMGVVNPSFSYDVLGTYAREQAYVGQKPTFGNDAFVSLTYDLGRLGFNEGTQIAVNLGHEYGTYEYFAQTGPYVEQFSVFMPFFDGRVSVQAGYYQLTNQFIGSTIGPSQASSALGPISSIPTLLGMSSFKPSPGVDMRVYSEDRKFYAHLGVSRSAHPEGFVKDWQLNRSGLRFDMPDAGALSINEFGYRVESSATEKKVWVRGGFIYNSSNFDYLDMSGRKGDNYGGYIVADFQLTQPSLAVPYNGWYVNAKFDKARDMTTIFNTDYSVTLYNIGLIKGRPDDVFSVGLSKNFYSDAYLSAMRASNLDPAPSVLSVSTAYLYKIIGGVYAGVGLTYTDNPTVAPRLPSALNISVAIGANF